VAAAVVLQRAPDGEAGEAGGWQLVAVGHGSRVTGHESRDRDGSVRLAIRDSRPVTGEIFVPDFRTGAMAQAATACFTGGRPIGWEGSLALWEKGYREPEAESRVTSHESRVGTDPAGRATRDARQATPAPPAFLPLIAQGRAVGVLYVQPVAPLSHGERRLIESLANHAAVALARERLVQEAARVRGLEEADRLKDALLSMVSHDFRSPLASIKASITGLLQDEGEWDPAVRQELLAGVDQETNRLNRLVEDLLDLSRLEAGAWQPEREPCAVTDLVALALGLLTPEQDARVVVRVPEDLPAVSADAGQIGRVLWNLLDNALKYSEGPVEVAAAAAGEVLILSVADRGPGLAPGEEEQVFAKFYRGAHFRESSVPGSGLGLSVCRALVEAHGGRLTAANRSGGGAEFRVELPCDAHPGH
jgi:two-component system sensor histidine kinase KdpD